MKLRYAIPVLLVVALLVLLAAGLRMDPTKVPSPLIGKPAPAFELRTLDGQPVRLIDLPPGPKLVNFWASWCTPCLVEHPLLLRLAREGVTIVGVDYKDPPEDARAWLDRHGNPFTLVITDPTGSAALDWGVYGVPETFVLDEQGIIRYKQIGPLTPDDWERHVRPALGAR